MLRHSRHLRRFLVLLVGAWALAAVPLFAQENAPITEGTLQINRPDGAALGVAPLKHTDVRADISGFMARVTVTQEFTNPYPDKIEAVYVFPLSQNAAVDDMTMRVGTRATIKGKILPREQARAVYEAARAKGQVASLLNQERPNIFTQNVANIQPNESVTITISYVETLAYEAGTYTFAFPMVVGPRYIPGNATGQENSGGRSPDTDRVPDASRITPPVAAKGMRAGHDISVSVNLDAGVPLDGFKSMTHVVETNQTDAARATVKLKNQNEIPNKDFVLKYDVAGRKTADALLTHRDERGGFFTFILQPPDRVTAEDVTPKEIVFVLDTSGSMGGFPIEKAKEAMKLAIDGLYPQDTFNLITFAGDTHILFPQPVSATKENLAKAQAFLADRRGGGGTEMMTAIRAALAPSASQKHVRIVCFMTDGYVGDDMTIIGEVQKYSNARVFSFGIGDSVNRYLLDKMAEAGRGEVEYVGLNDDGSAAARRFHERVRSPLLTDVEIDWNGLPVADVYPRRLSDLFSAKPITVTGRYTKAGAGVIRLKGKMAGREVIREIPVTLPEVQAEHDTLATLWARTRVDDLMNQDLAGAQRGAMKPELQTTITQLGLEYRLLTQFTSFVAVEELVINDGTTPRRVDVPVEVPSGVNRETTVESEEDEVINTSSNSIGSGRVAGLIPASPVSNIFRRAPAKPAPSRASKNKVAPPAVMGARIGSVNAIKQERKDVTFSGDADATATEVNTMRPEAAPADVKAVEAGRNPAPSSPSAPISGGVLNGKATSLPKPVYPPIAKAARAAGTVSVQVTIDESGKVIAAQPVSGHPLLQSAATQAAQGATFSPTLLSGQPVKITGVIVYNFNPDGTLGSPTAQINKVPPHRVKPEGAISGGLLCGKATSLPKPPYPAAAKAAKISGVVRVETVVDEKGQVIYAQAIDGPPLLQSAAEQAALQARFSPTLISGKPVKVSGIIVYNFVGDEPDNAATPEIQEPMLAKKGMSPTDDEATERQQLAARLANLRAKLQTTLAMLAERRLTNPNAAPAPDELLLAPDGQIEIQVSLVSKTPETLAKLQALGFTVTLEPQLAEIVIGRIAVAKLADLANLAEVRYVAPVAMK